MMTCWPVRSTSMLKISPGRSSGSLEVTRPVPRSKVTNRGSTGPVAQPRPPSASSRRPSRNRGVDRSTRVQLGSHAAVGLGRVVGRYSLRRSGLTTASAARSDPRSEPGTWRVIRPVVASMTTVRLVGPSPTWPTNVVGATAAGGPAGGATGGAGTLLRRWPASASSCSTAPAASRPARTSTNPPWTLRRLQRRTAATVAGLAAAWPAPARACRRARSSSSRIGALLVWRCDADPQLVRECRPAAREPALHGPDGQAQLGGDPLHRQLGDVVQDQHLPLGQGEPAQGPYQVDVVGADRRHRWRRAKPQEGP